MTLRVDISELVVDFVDDVKERMAKNDCIVIRKEDFVDSVLRHRKLNDIKTINTKWRQFELSGALQKRGATKEYNFIYGQTLKAFPDRSYRIEMLLYEGDEINKAKDRKINELRKPVCLREMDTKTVLGENADDEIRV